MSVRDTVNAVLDDVFNNGDGTVVEYNVDSLMHGLNLPDDIRDAVKIILEDTAYSRNVANALEADPETAFIRFIWEPGESGPVDAATTEMYIDTYRADAESGVEALVTYGEVFGA